MRVNSAWATTSRSTDTASSIDLPGTEQYLLDVSCFYNTGVRRRAIILANSLQFVALSDDIPRVLDSLVLGQTDDNAMLLATCHRVVYTHLIHNPKHIVTYGIP